MSITNASSPTIGISGNCAHRGDGSNDCSRDCWAASHLKRRRAPSQFVRRWHSLRTRPIGQRHRCVRHSPPASAPPGADMSSRAGIKRLGAPVADNPSLCICRARGHAQGVEATRHLRRSERQVRRPQSRHARRRRLGGGSPCGPPRSRTFPRTRGPRSTASANSSTPLTQRANANLPHNPDLRFESDGLVVSHLDRLEESPSLIALCRDIQARLPKGVLPDILLEVCARTHLADSFTHVSERGA